MKKWVGLGLVILLVFGVLRAFNLGIFSKKEGPQTLRLFGNVEIREVALGFRVPGRISSLVVDEGYAVEPGQILAKLDDEPFQNTFKHLNALYLKQQAHYQKLRNGYRKEDIEEAEAALKEAQAALTSKQKLINSVKALEEKARILVQRNEGLVEVGAISAEKMDILQSDLKTSVAKRQSMEAEIVQAQSMVNREKVILKKLNKGFRIEDIQEAHAQMKATLVERDDAERKLRDTVLKAPQAGTILSRILETGAIVSVGQPVLNQTIQDELWIRTFIPEPDLGLIHPGMKVKVYTDTKPDKPYEGTIGFISPKAEFTPKNVQTERLRTRLVFRFRVLVDKPDSYLRQGMPITVDIPIPTETSDPTPLESLRKNPILKGVV